MACTKVGYGDLASARAALVSVRKKAKPGMKVPRRVYRCQLCRAWHLTSRKPGDAPWWLRRHSAAKPKGAGQPPPA